MTGDVVAVTLRRADAGQWPTVEALDQLEQHDLSPWTGDRPGPTGRYDSAHLTRYFTEPDHAAHLIHADGQLAGFCLTRPFEGGSTFIHAFFVVRALRRSGVGQAAATELLRSSGGRWTIAFLEENAPAAVFWRRVATGLVGSAWTQHARPAPDGVHTFTFVTLDLGEPRLT